MQNNPFSIKLMLQLEHNKSSCGSYLMSARKTLNRLLLVTALLLVTNITAAQPGGFELRFNGDTISFVRVGLRIQDTAASVTITGPDDFTYSQTFQAGQLPEFDTRGLIDGPYNYEVRMLLPITADRTSTSIPDGQPKLNTIRRSGVFTVQAGQLASPDNTENPTRGTLPPGDQTIEGSLCVGLDCFPGLDFSFNTITLSENNTRLDFNDTSNSASFPGNDWTLVANDSTNGGANQFAIEDRTAGRFPFIVSAGAPNNTLFLDSSGRVGLGTGTPLVDLHSLNGNTPTIRLEQDGSGGFPAQAWDIGGNEAEFFIRDNTNFSLPFRVTPGAPSNSLTINNTGDIGLGTINPAAALHLQEDNVGPSIKLENIGTNNREWDTGLLDSTGDYSIDDATTGVTELVLTANGNLTIAGSLTSTRQADLPKISGLRSVNQNTDMSLNQLDKFIVSNQQLPGFEQQQGAHDVIAFQMQLLQTIQQLTVHTIEQQQQIEALQSRLARLEGKR